MGKESGLGDRLFVAQYDLSGDVGSVQNIAGPRSVFEVTGIDKSAPERILTLKDGAIGFAAWHNPSASQSHLVLSALPSSDVNVTYGHGSTVGNPAASMVAKQIDYDSQRGQDGSLAHAVQTQANGTPLEWGILLTAGKETIASAGNGTSVDDGSVSTTFGAAAYLHVTGITSGTATVTVHDSADNSTFAAVTGLAFTAASAATSERIATATTATIRRYVRIVTTGTFSNLVAVVNFVRFESSQST